MRAPAILWLPCALLQAPEMRQIAQLSHRYFQQTAEVATHLVWRASCIVESMHMLTHCLNLLKQKGIRYSHSIHPNAYTAASVADAERIPAGEMVKTVVYRGDDGFGMLLLPADRIVDFPQARRVLGLTSMSLADERELTELFPDSEVGAMPPFGNAFEFPVLMDETVADMKFVAFTAGTHRDVIRMSIGDLRRLVKPQIASFAFKEVAA